MTQRVPPKDRLQIMPADRQARRTAIWLTIAAALLGLAVFGLLTAITEELESLAAESPRLAMERAATVLEVSLAIAAALALIAAVWLARLATRILEVGQYPLPGARLTRDTAVRTGLAARRIAWLGFFCAVVLALAAVGLLVTGWQLTSMLTDARAATGPGIL
jgi:hypothetical protein